MITNKDKTPIRIYIQEDDNSMQYGINQDDVIKGIVSYVREDYVPNHSEMMEFAKAMAYHLDDRLCPYSREELAARAWLEGYEFAKRNWEYPDGVKEMLKGLTINEEPIEAEQ